jgi:hypothetical protein
MTKPTSDESTSTTFTLPQAVQSQLLLLILAIVAVAQILKIQTINLRVLHRVRFKSKRALTVNSC